MMVEFSKENKREKLKEEAVLEAVALLSSITKRDQRLFFPIATK